MKLTNDQITLLMGAGIVAVAVWYLSKKATQAAVAVGEAINPVSRDNIFYGGANAVTRALTGDQDATLGTKIYDWIHGE